MEKVQDQAPQDEIAQAPTAARAAALWWAKQVGAPVFKNTGPNDSPEDRQNGDLAGMMASLIADRSPVNQEQGAKFADALETVIAAMLVRSGGRWGASLGVDYGPDRELAVAADMAGISSSRFPWKTNMWVYNDHVTASRGYGAPTLLVWTEPGWVRPACNVQRYDEVGSDYVARDEVCGLPQYHEGQHGDYQADAKRCVECGKTYSQHYGQNRQAHIWEPAR